MSGTPASGSRKSILAVVMIAAVMTVGALFVLLPHLRSWRDKSKEAPARPSTIELVHLETFTVNLADNDHTFLRIGIDLGVIPVKESREEKNKGPEISIARDAILACLGAATSTELSSSDGRQKLKSDLLAALKGRVPQMQVREIYITEFLIQR